MDFSKQYFSLTIITSGNNDFFTLYNYEFEIKYLRSMGGVLEEIEAEMSNRQKKHMKTGAKNKNILK